MHNHRESELTRPWHSAHGLHSICIGLKCPHASTKGGRGKLVQVVEPLHTKPGNHHQLLIQRLACSLCTMSLINKIIHWPCTTKLLGPCSMHCPQFFKTLLPCVIDLAFDSTYDPICTSVGPVLVPKSGSRQLVLLQQQGHDA